MLCREFVEEADGVEMNGADVIFEMNREIFHGYVGRPAARDGLVGDD